MISAWQGMITWNEIPPITCTRPIYSNPGTCSICAWRLTREPVPQRDLISSSWAVDPGSRQNYTVASQAYGRGDMLERINNHLYAAGGDIKGDHFLQEASVGKNWSSPQGHRKRAWLFITMLNWNPPFKKHRTANMCIHRMNALFIFHTWSALIFHLTSIRMPFRSSLADYACLRLCFTWNLNQHGQPQSQLHLTLILCTHIFRSYLALASCTVHGMPSPAVHSLNHKKDQRAVIYTSLTTGLHSPSLIYAIINQSANSHAVCALLSEGF